MFLSFPHIKTLYEALYADPKWTVKKSSYDRGRIWL